MEQVKFKFEKLTVWQLAMDYGEEIYALSKKFPSDERFNLSSQMNRAVDSVALNIAEGATGQSNPEFAKFLGYSIRSLAEVVTCLHKASRRKYITELEFNANYEKAFELINKIAAIRKSIKD